MGKVAAAAIPCERGCHSLACKKLWRLMSRRSRWNDEGMLQGSILIDQVYLVMRRLNNNIAFGVNKKIDFFQVVITNTRNVSSIEEDTFAVCLAVYED